MIDSAEAASGRLGAVLRASGNGGLAQVGPHGPWVTTSPAQARQVLTDAEVFDFPVTVSRGTDMSSSFAETRTGHHIYPPLTTDQVERGSTTFRTQWRQAVSALRTTPAGGSFEAMSALRVPMARATCSAILPDAAEGERDKVADQVLAWIDALGPVIARTRNPGRWSRLRRREESARVTLESTLGAVLPRLGISESPQVVATLLAAGIQVPIAAGAWLLVLVAAADARDARRFDPDHVVWETLRIAPPTWITARVTRAPVTLAGHRLAAGEVVLVSPLLLGRAPELVPGSPVTVGTFDPDRWRREDPRPGAWLPFGGGAHACPGRSLGFRLLRDLAIWAADQELSLTQRVRIDQTRGIWPSPATVSFVTSDTMST